MSDRMRKVNEAVRAAVAESIGTLKDPRIGIVTVTGVSVSPDLHDARVFVSVFGSKKKQTAAFRALESGRARVQTQMASRLQMKRTPQIAFEYDTSVEHAVRITQLIDEVASDLPPDDDPADDSTAD